MVDRTVSIATPSGPAGRAVTTWEPILHGADGDLAHIALHALAKSLRDINQVRFYGASLGRGAAGVAVFLAYLTQDHDQPNLSDPARPSEYLRLAIESDQAAEPQDLGLFGGLTGIAWTAEHLVTHGSFGGQMDWRQSVADKLIERLRSESWRGHYEVVSGLAGYAIYALERHEHADSLPLLRLIVKRLTELATATTDHPAWWTSADDLPDEHRRHYPRGCVDLGMAHGVPGAIAILGRLLAAGIEPDVTRLLLERTIRSVLAQRQPASQRSTFATAYTVDDASGPTPSPARSKASRLAWCYGDLGIAAAIYAAAVQLNASDWQADALAIARRAATRTLADSGVVDAGLCHGAAGVAHLFNRLYQATRESIFLDAACFWYVHTLTFYRPGTGIGGFSAWRDTTPSHTHWLPWPGLVEGSAGIGLALLAATTSIEPAWDRALALALPVAAADTQHPRNA